ncbi:Uncharacterized protein PECH_004256 [Penicillium ucsense]|uniref:WD repeat protein n=1 Tax=Penicillium ucsense TaxID=2839758 RepID=A0A8J8W8G1_9EURO|nr:Uncharacterized protein PECM_001180 [Penicillium ucsense]KAF7737145.1 Uncharacterized protein PECH_004256 [Penicillium ucsense]
MASSERTLQDQTDHPEDPSVRQAAREWSEEADDTTEPDYQPSQSRSDDDEWEDEADEEADELMLEANDIENDNVTSATAQGGLTHINLGGIHIEFNTEDIQEDDDADEDDAIVVEDNGAANPTVVSRSRIFQLLASTGLREILRANGWPPGPEQDDDDDDYDDEELLLNTRMRRGARHRKPRFEWPKVPSDEGTNLMNSGHFGTNPYFVDRIKKRKGAFASNLMWRELGIGSHGLRMRTDQSIFQSMLPGSQADKIIHFDSRSYSGQFSDDGNFFFCCEQDFKVRMYDTSNPYQWKYYKTVEYPFGQWTITDASLSPDNRFLVYSSIRSAAYLAPTDPEDDTDPSLLDFSLAPGRARHYGLESSRSRFGIWSLRFSGDGREIVAGTSDNSVVVLDLETRTPVLSLQDRHQHHVNAVCFGDTSSPHILYSGSDDTTLRVWDRRSMADGREAGVFMGHTEGLTYIDSKGDGRYVLSNSKDQTMKLWDLRKMMSASKADEIEPDAWSTDFDYRFEEYPESDREAHPHDHSVVTFHGHKVLKTLIRCHFSPPGSTNSRYIYTGSSDGQVYVYNMDATLAGTIDVRSATMNSRPRGPETLANVWDMGGDSTWRTCVRDASWHPNVPMIAATSWNGWGLSTGTCTVHSWNDGADNDEGDPPIGRNFDHKLRPLPHFNNYRATAPSERAQRRARRPLRSRPVARTYADDAEEGDGEW